MEESSLIEQCMFFVTDSLFQAFEFQNDIWAAIGGVSGLLIAYFTVHSLLRFYVQRMTGAQTDAKSDYVHRY